MPEIVRPDGARIHYTEHGEGFPVLLLAPGGVSSESESWKSALYDPVRELADRYRVIMMDQRHAGRSTAPAAPFSYEQFAGDQLAVLNELDIERAHLLGEGIGVAYALRLACDAPERVRSLVCQQPIGRDATNGLGVFFRPFDEAMRLVRAEGFDGVFAAAAEDGRFDRNPGAGPFAQRLHDDTEYRAELRSLGRERYIGLLVRFRDGMFPDSSPYFSIDPDRLSHVTVPSLLVAGGGPLSPEDPLSPEGVVKRLAALVPDARLLDLGADVADRPRAVAESVVSFLADHTPR